MLRFLAISQPLYGKFSRKMGAASTPALNGLVPLSFWASCHLKNMLSKFLGLTPPQIERYFGVGMEYGHA